jgi:pilus assembly protein CpaD
MAQKHSAGHFAAALALRGLVLAGIGLAITGCQTTAQEPPDPYTGGIWSDYRQRHPISFIEADRTLDIFVGSGRALTPDQRANVLGFAQTWREEGSGRFLIERPSQARNAQATSAAVSEIRSILLASGIPGNAIKVQSHRTFDRNLLAVVTVSYPRVTAHVHACGRWPDDLGPSADRKHFENIEYWNFGCATRSNLAAIVKDPQDLVQPRAETPIYTARRTTVLDKHRKGEATATTYPNPDKGAISDLGK